MGKDLIISWHRMEKMGINKKEKILRYIRNRYKH